MNSAGRIPGRNRYPRPATCPAIAFPPRKLVILGEIQRRRHSHSIGTFRRYTYSPGIPMRRAPISENRGNWRENPAVPVEKSRGRNLSSGIKWKWDAQPHGRAARDYARPLLRPRRTLHTAPLDTLPHCGALLHRDVPHPADETPRRRPRPHRHPVRAIHPPPPCLLLHPRDPRDGGGHLPRIRRSDAPLHRADCLSFGCMRPCHDIPRHVGTARCHLRHRRRCPPQSDPPKEGRHPHDRGPWRCDDDVPHP